MGHFSGPLDFPPREVLSWRNRFDHPDKLFRTLYCAEQRLTALREVLADFRPNAKARADYRALNGEDLPAPQITAAWRQVHVLAQGRLRLLQGELVDVDSPALRQHFEQQYADLLARQGMVHLDISQVRSKDRIITQELTRFLADHAAAGILYGSNLDNLPCAALFENRAMLVPASSAEALTLTHADLIQVCQEFGLVLSKA